MQAHASLSVQDRNRSGSKVAKMKKMKTKTTKTTKTSLRKILTGSVGSEIAEAALVIPIFFMIMLGIYWFGRAFNTYATINHAAREGARLAVAQTCATCATPNGQPTPNQLPRKLSKRSRLPASIRVRRQMRANRSTASRAEAGPRAAKHPAA
jgi:uncharacterized iron-regulated membrane protein